MLKFVAGRDMEAQRTEAVAELFEHIERLDLDAVRWLTQLAYQLSQRPSVTSARRSASGP